MRSILLVGGTGTISLSVTRLLASDTGWRVTILNRGSRGSRGGEVPAGIESLSADIADAATVRAVLASRR